MPGIQAPISHGGAEHDYVISHRRDEHNVSYRPPGKHEHVGTFASEREAKAAAALHASSSRSVAPQVTKDTKTMSSKKPPAQLNREIAQSLAASGQSQLAAVFADPVARKVFAREMRHELLTQQTSRATAAGLAARPFTYKRAGEGIVGRFATQVEAESWAKSKGGWVEHGDRVVYGTKPSAHATRKAKAPRPSKKKPHDASCRGCAHAAHATKKSHATKKDYDWESFAEGAALAFWASPYMSEVENLAEESREVGRADARKGAALREAYDALSPGPGGAWESVMPEPPPAARAVAKKFTKAARVKLTDEQLGEISAKFSPHDAGYYGGMQSQGEGVGWFNEGVRVDPPRGFSDDPKIHNALSRAISKGAREAGVKLPRR